MNGRILIAGIGNVFLGDDGFGVEVASRLAQNALPSHVRVVDAGIRGRHLAFELLDGGYDTAILVDAAPRGGPPGSLYVIEPEPAGDADTFEGHGLTPDTVLALVERLRGGPRVLIVGCEPADVDERMGLSAPVAAAVDDAVALVRRLVCA